MTHVTENFPSILALPLNRALCDYNVHAQYAHTYLLGKIQTRALSKPTFDDTDGLPPPSHLCFLYKPLSLNVNMFAVSFRQVLE